MLNLFFFFLIFLQALQGNAEITIVDFDESMGIENRARYNLMLREDGANEDLNFFRELWKKNNPNNKKPIKSKKIPKILHQIWIGPKPLPKLYQKFQSVCKALHPDWEYRFWTNKEAAELEFDNKEIFYKTKSYDSKADILRYEILKRYGGVYLDIDVLCLEPLDELTEKYSFFAGLEPPLTYKRPMISNAQIGTFPGNQLFDNALKLATKDQKILDTTNEKKMPPFTIAFLDEKNLHENSVIFPATYFIPIFPEAIRYKYSFRDNLKLFFNEYEDKPLFISIRPESLTHHEFNE